MDLQVRRFDQPDERRSFEKGMFQLVTAGGMTLGRASYEPGWKWSEHIGPTVGASRCTVEHVGLVLAGVATVNGTMALSVALKAVGVEPGDEVLVPAYTFPATANVVIQQGARPVLVDLAPGSQLLDPDYASVTTRTQTLYVLRVGRSEDLSLYAVGESCEGATCTLDYFDLWVELLESRRTIHA